MESKGAGESPPAKVTGPSPMKPRSLQPPHTGGRTRPSPVKPLHPDESENMNPDEVGREDQSGTRICMVGHGYRSGLGCKIHNLRKKGVPKVFASLKYIQIKYKN